MRENTIKCKKVLNLECQSSMILRLRIVVCHIVCGPVRVDWLPSMDCSQRQGNATEARRQGKLCCHHNDPSGQRRLSAAQALAAGLSPHVRTTRPASRVSRGSNHGAIPSFRRLHALTVAKTDPFRTLRAAMADSRRKRGVCLRQRTLLS